MKQLSLRRALLLPLLWGILSAPGFGQADTIDLATAQQLARDNYAGLERDRLSVEQLRQLTSAGLPQQPAQIYFSSEEFDFGDQSAGIQSLYAQQNFYLPRAQRAQRQYYQSNVAVAEKQLALTEQDLQRRVAQAYYRLQHTRSMLDLATENLALYRDFLSVTSAQLTSGETGQLPQLAARTRLGQARLEREHAEDAYLIAREQFNFWLGATDRYEATPEPLPVPDSGRSEAIRLEATPHLALIAARQEQAAANITVQETRLLPQLNTAVQVQNAFGNFPYFGYQLGVNVPLFRRAYRNRIAAAEVAVKVQDAALAAERQELERKLAELYRRLDQELATLTFLAEELRPVAATRNELNLAAYREGTISYLEYLDSLEQALLIEKQYAVSRYRVRQIRTELDFWLGR